MSLDRFVEDARRRVEQGYYDAPADVPRAPPLTEVLGAGAVVAELKPRAPATGRLLDGPPAAVVADYVAGGAAALSILTDPDHFDGGIHLLALGHATGLPVLMKDFIVDARQVDAAARNGCSGVLLIERVLGADARERLVRHAHRRNLDVVLEVHSVSEWEAAQGSAADIIGVNARDLDTLEMDRRAQLHLVRQVAATGRRVMALSGIRCRKERLEAEAAGATGVLVGSSRMAHPQPVLALRALRRPRVKVCGLMREEDVATAAQAGADMAGIIVLADSPRCVSLEAAGALVEAARRHGLRPVLVTPAPAADVVHAAKALRPDLVQWHHAGEPPDLRGLGIGLLHAVGPDDAVPADGGLVLDAARPGSGATHDWQRAGRAVAADPARFTLIAGGLAADNVLQALRATGAWGADASSRLETAPGRKDPAAVQAFVRAARDG